MIIIQGANMLETQISNGAIWGFLGAILAAILTFYVLRSIGIYTMAKKAGVKYAFIAWFPLIWFYTACKLVGKVRFFGSTFGKLAVWFTLIFSVGELLTVFYNFIALFPIVGNLLQGNVLYMFLGKDVPTTGFVSLGSGFYGAEGAFVDPYAALGISSMTLYKVVYAIYYLMMIFDVAVIVLSVSLYINLFRKYAPRHFILFSVLSWLGVFAPFVFAVRNREPVDYKDYLRSRYNAWYANGNPYGGATPNGQPQTPPNPFSEFADKDETDPGDPFSNFNNNNQNGNDEK